MIGRVRKKYKKIFNRMDKETIKQFLKPNKWKILILVILILISLFIGVQMKSYYPPPTSFVLPPHTKVYFNPVLWLPYYLSNDCPGREPCIIIWLYTKEGDITSLVITLLRISLAKPYLPLMTLIYWYFISCAIVFIYDKFKTKK